MVYRCDECAFECTKQSGMQRHEMTKKHAAAVQKRSCPHCGRQFQSQSGLWKHGKAKTCRTDDTRELLDELKAQQAQIVQLLSSAPSIEHHEHHEHHYHQTTTTTTTTNVIIYLEKECGGALNWLDFVKGLSIHLENDLTESIIKTMCAGIEALGEHRRPIHCLDAVCRKVYLKTNDAWESDAAKIKGAFRESDALLQTRCVQMIQAWDDLRPEWHQKESEVEEYRKLAVQITEGVDTESWVRTQALTQRCLKTLTV